MKNIKTQQEIKAIEEMVMNATGLANVEIVVPASMRELPSVDYRLLEMENKLNLSRHRTTPRQARKEAKLAARTGMMDKVAAAFDSACDVIEEPKNLLKIKPIGAVANYFFLLDEEEEVEEVVIPMKESVPALPPQEGNVIYLNFNK